jgi:hypothetical protein
VFGDDAIILKDHTSITSFFIKKMEVLLQKKRYAIVIEYPNLKIA